MLRRSCRAPRSASAVPCIGNNGAGDPWHLAQPRRARAGLAGPQLAARRDLVGGGDQLRGLRTRTRPTCWVCLFDDDDGGETPAPADRAVPRHLARRAPGPRPGHPLRLPRRRPVGARAGAALQPAQAAARPLRAARSSGDDHRRPGDLRLRRRRRPTQRDARATPRRTSARSVVVDPTTSTGRATRRCARRWRDTVIYELHVKGMTAAARPGARGAARHVRRPRPPRRSTDYLRDLGVTAVELLPVHQFFSEPALRRARAGQLLGLQLDRLLRPARAYSSSGDRGQQVTEFKQMVKALHARRPRGDPRRRLQPHRRGRRRTARRCPSAGSTTAASTSRVGRRTRRRGADALRRHLLGRHRLRQHRRHRRTRWRCG